MGEDEKAPDVDGLEKKDLNRYDWEEWESDKIYLQILCKPSQIPTEDQPQEDVQFEFIAMEVIAFIEKYPTLAEAVGSCGPKIRHINKNIIQYYYYDECAFGRKFWQELEKLESADESRSGRRLAERLDEAQFSIC